MMIDTLRLFDSLDQATEFTVTEDHLKLLRAACYVYWNPGEGYGAPAINPKKPYGNSDVPRDVAKILEAPGSDWEEDPDWDWDDDEGFPPESRSVPRSCGRTPQIVSSDRRLKSGP